MKINEKIKRIRTDLKMTQEDFSYKIGISRSTLAQIETGKSNPTFEAISSICSIFKVDANYLYTETENVGNNVLYNVNLNVDSSVNLNSEIDKNSNDNGVSKGNKVDHFSLNKKITAFYKKVYEIDPELDKFMTFLSNLEWQVDDLKLFIEKINQPINDVYEAIASATSKEVVSTTFVEENIKRLLPLKQYKNAVDELHSLIESVLIFEDFKGEKEAE